MSPCEVFLVSLGHTKYSLYFCIKRHIILKRMSRRAREISGTGIYHVMMRGINRQNIFEDDESKVQVFDSL